MKEETDPVREHARSLAREFLVRGDSFGWFEALYAEAEGDNEHIPWADLEPNRFLLEWDKVHTLNGNGRQAMVVGCGLGDDARFLYDRGFEVTAFDISRTAVDWARSIHRGTDIDFHVADIFAPPAG